MEKQIYNFASAPSMLPKEVLQQIERDMISYNDSGVSVMELTQGSPAYREIINSAEKLLREVVHIPSSYKVLFIAGSYTDQFTAVPMNLFSGRKVADYILSGQASKAASLEAKRYGDVHIAASSAGASPVYSAVPEAKRSDFRPDTDFVHIRYNSQIYGTKFHYIPDTGNIPLVADMTSCFLSEPIDISKYALIYADAQINLSIAGLTVVIVRSDLIGSPIENTPANYDYSHIADEHTQDLTPPLFNIYVAKLVLEWIRSVGGLEEMKRRNEKKASRIYDYLDSQFYYAATADKKCRSMTNITFTTASSSLDERFCIEASLAGLMNLKGHESVGGMCASIYNSMDSDGVDKLVEFMRNFAKDNSKISG